MEIPVRADTAAERRLLDNFLALARGLKLSRDLELAEAALHFERDAQRQLNGNGQLQLLAAEEPGR